LTTSIAAATLPDGIGVRHPLPGDAHAIYHAALVSWEAVERLLGEMIAQQEGKVLALARRLVPNATPEDVRNPQDFAALVESADFNYEDGILAGLKAAAVAVRAARRAPPKG
jgi:hypothetical protein